MGHHGADQSTGPMWAVSWPHGQRGFPAHYKRLQPTLARNKSSAHSGKVGRMDEGAEPAQFPSACRIFLGVPIFCLLFAAS